MNWKLMAAAILGLAVGLCVAPFAHKTVLASAAPADAHFQMQSATVDESNGQGQNVPAHEVFLLDTASGSVWKFQGLEWGKDKNGNSVVFAKPVFVKIAVEQGK